MKRIIAYLCAAFLGVAAGLACGTAFTVTTVTDDAMAPALIAGQHVMLTRFGPEDTTLIRGDVVAMETPLYMETGEDGRMLKRIVGMPGEEISIADGLVWIDGSPLRGQPFDQIRIGNETMTVRKVPAESYFVLGDNLPDSTDSRNVTVGMVKREDILGKVILEW